MNDTPRLTPRQQDCLRLVWERQATSKEIAATLGIGKGTVDNYIAQAVEALGARDRREAAAILFGRQPRDLVPPAKSTVDSTGVGDPLPGPAALAPSTKVSRPWRSGGRRNDMSLAQTLLWILAIALGSLIALSLAVSVGNGLRPIVSPALAAFDRLTH